MRAIARWSDLICRSPIGVTLVRFPEFSGALLAACKPRSDHPLARAMSAYVRHRSIELARVDEVPAVQREGPPPEKTQAGLAPSVLRGSQQETPAIEPCQAASPVSGPPNKGPLQVF